MAYREVSRVEIAEVVRRWQSGNSQRQIATGTGLSRATVRRYIVAAMGAGLTRDGAAPSEDQLSRLAGLNLCTPRKVETPTEDVLAPWADQVYKWLTADRLQVTRIHELLAGRGCRVSYTSLRRFIQRRGWQRRSPATVRMGESAPVVAVDPDGDPLASYLGLEDEGSNYFFFDYSTSTGQLFVSDAGADDYVGLDADQIYPVIVTAADRRGKWDKIEVGVYLDSATPAPSGDGLCP